MGRMTKVKKIESYGNGTTDNEELDYLFNQYYHNNMKKKRPQQINRGLEKKISSIFVFVRF